MTIRKMPGSTIERQGRLHEAGRIRLGAKKEGTRQDGSKFTRPDKLSFFRLTSPNLDALQVLAGLYGGEPVPWATAPHGKEFELYTESDVLDVMVPPERMSLSQSNELWVGGGCLRRCDGIVLDTGGPCVCAQLEDEGVRESKENPRCKPTTRLSVMLQGVPLVGMWRVETKGFYAAEELRGAFDLGKIIVSVTGASVLPGSLRLTEREVKRPGQQPRNFVVPTLSWDVDVTALTGGARALGGATMPAPAALPAGLTPVPDDEADKAPAPPLLDQLTAEPKKAAPRKNAAPILPATGVKPHPVGEDPSAAPAQQAAPRRQPAQRRSAGEAAPGVDAGERPPAATSPPAVASVNVAGMSIRDLTMALEAAGLALTGNRAEKNTRYSEYLAAQQAPAEVPENAQFIPVTEDDAVEMVSETFPGAEVIETAPASPLSKEFEADDDLSPIDAAGAQGPQGVQHVDRKITDEPAFKMMMAQFNQLGMSSADQRDIRMNYVRAVVGDPLIGSCAHLTIEQIGMVIDSQQRDIEIESGSPGAVEPPAEAFDDSSSGTVNL